MASAAAALYAPAATFSGLLSPRSKGPPPVFSTATASSSALGGAGAPIATGSAAPGPSFPGPNYPASNSSGYGVGMGGAAGSGPSYPLANDPLSITGPPPQLPPRGFAAPPAAPIVPLNASDLARQVAEAQSGQQLPGQALGMGPGLGMRMGMGMGGGQPWARYGGVENLSQLPPEALDAKGPIVSPKTANV